jgi:hypothetical protein
VHFVNSRSGPGRIRVLLAVLALAAGLAALAVPAGTPARAAAAGGASPAGCHEVFQPPSTWVVICQGGGGTPGGGGGGGGGGGKGGGLTCTLQILSAAQIHFLGLGKAPAGEEWAAITCPGKQPFGGVTLVSKKTGAPTITPRELMEYAWKDLTIPVLNPALAPPTGKDGLVGLPEWYWIPKGWAPVRTPVARAGPVWAQVTATPVRLSFDPGGGLGGTSCAGPGTPYVRGGHTACSYLYTQSSATQPGGSYQVVITVTWKVTWAGGVGPGATAGGTLPSSFIRSFLDLKVAESQALVTGTGVK